LDTKQDIILVSNSPGELSALVKPVAESIAEKMKDSRIILFLTPCQYTSGKELEYLKTIPEITEIIPSESYKTWILRNRKPKIDFSKKGLVLYLGGDLGHAMLIARKVKYPALAYVQDRISWTGFYKKFFVPDAKSKRKFARGKKIEPKIKIVGNLMVDSVNHLPQWKPESNVITFLPGSRQWQIKHMTPLYEKIIKQLKAKIPGLKVQLVSSPFQPAAEIKGAKMIDFDEAYNSELVITIPGTNTARLAARGIPMIVVFPLDNTDVIPLEGLAHFIGKIPHLGSKFKKTLIQTLNKRIKYFALPNIKAEQEIVPEYRGAIDIDTVVMKTIDLLQNDKLRKKMSEDLKRSMGEPGASGRIVEEINETLRQAA